MGIIKQYGKNNLQLDAHSRGGLTVFNAFKHFNNLKNQEYASGITVNMFGSAANVQKTADLLYSIANDGSRAAVGRVQYQSHLADIVSSFLGGNKPTGGTIPDRSSSWKEKFRVPFRKETAHNSYGTKQGLVNAKKSGEKDFKDLTRKRENYFGSKTPTLVPVMPNIK